MVNLRERKSPKSSSIFFGDLPHNFPHDFRDLHPVYHIYHMWDLICYIAGMYRSIKTTYRVCFFSADFQPNKLGDSINVRNLWLVLQSSSSEKKNIDKTSNNCYFGPDLQRKELALHEPHTKCKTIIFAEIAKADHKFSKTLSFLKKNFYALIKACVR